MRMKLLPGIIILTTVLSSSISFGELENSIGKKYTKDNAEEVEKYLPQPVYNWVKNGYIEINTDKVDYPFKGPEKFQEITKTNTGKYSVDEDGNLIDLSSGEIPEFLYGLPFPHIDKKDPKNGIKIMWNFYFQQFQTSSQHYKYDICWVSYKDFERNFTGSWKRLFYTGRYNGAIENPDSVDFKDMITVVSPHDVAGISSMLYRKKLGGGTASDLLWTYAPALRRTRRLSPSNSSDAFLGSDIANDDALGYRAKIQSFDWKLIGEAEMLCPFGSAKPSKLIYSEEEKGWTTTGDTPFVIYGYDHEKWEGSAWAPVNIIWDLRPVYIIEGMPKDPYYNYGKQIFVLDKDALCIYNKEIYDRGGSYWKNMLSGFNWIYAPGEEDKISTWMLLFHCIVDEKSNHATVTHQFVENPPCIFASDVITDDQFTQKALLTSGK